jgi:hypothetical protein
VSSHRLGHLPVAMLAAVMQLRRSWLLVLVSLAVTPLALTGCGRTYESRPGWVIHSQLSFLSDDLRAERPALAPSQFRLLFPYIAGDLYGPPTTGDFIHPALAPDYRFEIDLNRTHAALVASLEKTEFSVSYLHIAPQEARVARLAPQMFQSDGIEQVGRLEWLDPNSRQELLLLYLDRPASITGGTSVRGRPLRYDIRTAAADYVWVGRQSTADEDVYSVVPRPARLLLAVRPVPGQPQAPVAPASDPLPAVSRAHTDTPVR